MRQVGKVYKKIAFVLFLMIIINIGIFWGYNTLNINVTQYSELKQNTLDIENVDDSMHVLLLTQKDHSVYTFNVESDKKQPVTFVYEDSESGYIIKVNNHIERQNIDKSMAGYTKEIAYGVIHIESNDYVDQSGHQVAQISIKNYSKALKNPMVLYSSREGVRKYLAIRSGYSTIMLGLFFIILIISGFIFFKDRVVYMFVVILIGLTSLYKSVVSGEFILISNLVGITSSNFLFIDRLTSAINYILYQSLVYRLFDFKLKKRYIIIYSAVYLVLVKSFITDRSMIFYVLGAIVIFSMKIMGYVKRKPHAMILIITYSVFSGCNMCNIALVANIIKQGFISSIVLGPQIGSIIYVLGFLVSVFFVYVNKMKLLEKQHKEIEKLDLIRGISHDLRLPLSVAKLNYQMIENYEMSSKERKEYMDASMGALLELEKMTDNLNYYINAERFDQIKHKASIQESINKIEKYYRLQHKDDLTFSVDCDLEDYYLPIIPMLLDRLLYNLVDNAFKYNKQNGEVTIRYQLNKEVMISVEDTGIGMDKDKQELIFDAFYRIDNNRSIDGLGLGLGVVKEIVNGLEGKIEVISQKNIGTKIKLYFPIKK